MIMIYDGEDALFVDVSLCLSALAPARWLGESKAVVMAMGHLEACRSARMHRRIGQRTDHRARVGLQVISPRAEARSFSGVSILGGTSRPSVMRGVGNGS